jgi:hypothetical protein
VAASLRIVRVALVLLVAAPAHADDALSARAHAEQTTPLLVFDPLPPPALHGATAIEAHDDTTYQFDARTSLALAGTHWSASEMLDHPEHTAFDLPARGWGASARLRRTIGSFVLEAGGAYDHVDSRYGSGSYVDLGLALTRYFHLSRWMTAWISIGIGNRIWLGQPPAGESNATQVRLSIGTTFR